MIAVLIIIEILLFFIFWPAAFLGLYVYAIYKLFFATIEKYNNGEMEKFTRNLIITAIVCLPAAIIELLYIQVMIQVSKPHQPENVVQCQ